jgi:hypothetical protein
LQRFFLISSAFFNFSPAAPTGQLSELFQQGKSRILPDNPFFISLSCFLILGQNFLAVLPFTEKGRTPFLFVFFFYAEGKKVNRQIP